MPRLVIILSSIGDNSLIKKALTFFAVCFLLFLWVASWQLNLSYLIAGIYSVVSLITFLVYGWDKRLAAEHGENVIRVPERTLHILGVFGGWPGSLVAQQWLRHKSKKRRFIFVLWLTIIANGCALSLLCYLQYM